MRGNVSLALEWYERAVDAGHRRFWPDEVDPAFQPLRDEPGFEAQLERMRAAVSRMRQAVAADVELISENLTAS